MTQNQDENIGGFLMPPEVQQWFKDWTAAGCPPIIGRITWQCLKCGSFWPGDVEHCTCGNPGPMKRPGPTEFK